MKISVKQGDIVKSSADTLVVNLFAGITQPGGATGAIDRALDGAITDLIAGGDFGGERDEVAVLYPRGAIRARRVLVTGLGERESFDLEAIRRAAATAAQRARELQAEHLATIVHGAGIGSLPVAVAAQATMEGTLLALYQYDAQGVSREKGHEISSLTLKEFDGEKVASVAEGAKAAQAIAAGVELARDMVNMPPNIATPTRLAEMATEIAGQSSVHSFVGDRDWAKQQQMGAFLAVGQGAREEPAFVVLECNRDQPELPTVVLVGKGITFDSGGLSLKPVEGMGKMKADMGGAAAVLGAMKAISMLNLPLHVVSITPFTENMPDGAAYRPADVITASNGKTIEIISTDAEGRMTLADALVYAQRYEPQAVVDLATLTGSCVIALGQGVAAGLFANDDGLRTRLEAAAQATHERIWPLPLWEEYRRKIDSDVADMKNSGGKMGGVGTSAIFLQEFTDYRWAHLDIAGLALQEKAEKPYTQRGATGFGVRLLVQFLRDWSY